PLPVQSNGCLRDSRGFTPSKWTSSGTHPGRPTRCRRRRKGNWASLDDPGRKKPPPERGGLILPPAGLRPLGAFRRHPNPVDASARILLSVSFPVEHPFHRVHFFWFRLFIGKSEAQNGHDSVWIGDSQKLSHPILPSLRFRLILGVV